MADYDISTGSGTLSLSGLNPNADYVGLQINQTGLDASITLTLKQSMDDNLMSLTNSEASKVMTTGDAVVLLQSFEFKLDNLYLDIDVGSATTGTLDVFSVNRESLEFTTETSSGAAWGDITGTLSDQTDLQAELDGKKDDFSENTAFNKNFGTSAGTVLEGDTPITDPDAIHDNVAGEITALTQKNPASTSDNLIMEDSSDSFNKVRVKPVGLTNAVFPAFDKGQLSVHDGSDIVYLAIGTDDQVLTADSAATEGVSYKLPKISVSKNSGATVGTRPEINLIEGTNVDITIADDSGNDEVDILIASTPTATITEVNTGTEAGKLVTPVTLENKTYGTFTGTTITDNVKIKVALQELETAVEAAGGGFTSGSVTGNSTITTTSATYVAMTGMTITTPAAGDYLVWFSVSGSNSANNGDCEIAIYTTSPLTQEVDTPRRLGVRDIKQADIITEISTFAKITVNGSENIDGRWNNGGSGTATVTERSMMYLKVG